MREYPTRTWAVFMAFFPLVFSIPGQSAPAPAGGESCYTTAPVDAAAVYLTLERFGVVGDGVADDTAGLQAAINAAKAPMNYGILFIPEGRYRISKTIYVPKAVRLIGYGAKRPEIVLGANTPGFQTPDANDKGQAQYMLWFTDSVPQQPAGTRALQPGAQPRDAGAGTFYSALTNVNLTIEDGNPAAVALRTHYAQHCFISHVDIVIGNGKAGIFDVGNEIQDVRFTGGDYGIYTTKPSPGWQFTMLDTVFEDQRVAAVLTQEAGLTVVRMTARRVPTVIATAPGFIEKLYMEDCTFEDVSGPAIIISEEDNTCNWANLRNITCHHVPTLAGFRGKRMPVKGAGDIYRVESFTHGNQMSDLDATAGVATTCEMAREDAGPPPASSDIPALPPVNTWVNVRDCGVVGDGVADDTHALQAAITAHAALYFPLGRYRVSDTITLRPDTDLIGLHPIGTQIFIADNTEAFGQFGPPKPLLEVPQGGTNIVTGIGLDAGARNPRAFSLKWMAGERSYLNDVKFVGGHGGMNPDGSGVPVYNATRNGDANPDNKWDAQYWSLWVTGGGGGVFNNIWTASPYAAAGVYVTDTDTPGRIYCLSCEHHVRNEVLFRNVGNWKVLALQCEEEAAESPNCQPLELDRCHDLLFVNTYLFRTIWLDNPYPDAILTWDPRNIEFLGIHNFTQVKYTINNTLLDENSGVEVRPWQLARLEISGATAPRAPITPGPTAQKLAGGFNFVDAICKDSVGNVYFLDSKWKRIYQWSVETNSLSLITAIPFRPLSLACDTKDNLLVLVEYFPPKGATVNGQPETYPKPPDAQGTAYGKWYNTGSTVMAYSIDPEHPDASMQVLKTVPMADVKQVAKVLYPANRWRDNNDFLTETVSKPAQCFLAPDDVTVIPICYDLIRATGLLEAVPGHTFYAVDEYYKRTVRYDVTPEGYLTNAVVFAARGEYSVAVGADGDIYIPDGDLTVYSPTGVLLDTISIPDRPACVCFAGADGKTLFITARSSLYVWRK